MNTQNMKILILNFIFGGNSKIIFQMDALTFFTRDIDLLAKGSLGDVLIVIKL